MNSNLNILKKDNNDNIIKTLDFEIYLQSEDYKLKDQIIERKLKIINKHTKEESICTQLHIICWPDHSIPNSDIYYNLINCIVTEIDYYKYNLNSKEPVIVHCSAGIGRTGTLISLYNIYDQINRQIRIINSEKEKDANYNFKIYFSVFNQVRKLREQRFMSVTDSCQYNMIYSFIYEYLKLKTDNINNSSKNLIIIGNKIAKLKLEDNNSKTSSKFYIDNHEENNFSNDGNNININS